MAFALFTRARLLLDRHTGGEHLRRRRLRLMLRTGQLIHPASNPASQRRTGASLPGTLASPGTGLSPAGCPELQEQDQIAFYDDQTPFRPGRTGTSVREPGHRC